VTETPALSKAWRRNRSSIQAVELASSIKSLRKVIGSLVPGTCVVNYNTAPGSGSYNRNTEAIFIDPEYAVKSSPISDEDFDVLTGLAVHEAMHTVCGSHEIAINNSEMAAGSIDKEAIAAVGEEIYCDAYARRNYGTPGKYISIARSAYKVDERTINWNNLLNAWLSVALYRRIPPDNLPVNTLKSLSVLLPYTKDLRTKDMSPYIRKTLYEEISRQLKKAGVEQAADDEKIGCQIGAGQNIPGVGTGDWTDRIVSGEGPTDNDTGEDSDNDADDDPEDEATPGNGTADDDRDSDNYEDADDDEGTGDEGSGSESSVRPLTSNTNNSALPMHAASELSKELTEELDRVLDQNVEDITEELTDILTAAIEQGLLQHRSQRILGTTEDSSVTVSNAPSTNGLVSDVDNELFTELQWMDRVKNAAGREIVRFEERGRVDRSTLYRAKIDQKIFRTSRVRQEADMEAVMLLDASASMGTRNSVYEAAYAIHRVIPSMPLYSYDEIRRQVRLFRHGIGGELRRVQPEGGTPTGLALLAILKEHPESLVILFSDGDSNVGIHPSEVIQLMPAMYPKAKVLYIQFDPYGYELESGDQIQVVSTRDLAAVPGIMRDALRPWFRMN
jgi:hypothetical protein